MNTIVSTFFNHNICILNTIVSTFYKLKKILMLNTIVSTFYKLKKTTTLTHISLLHLSLIVFAYDEYQSPEA